MYKNVLIPGFISTGDLGYCDEDGYLYILGRIQDSVYRSGSYVDVFAIENLLESHSGIMEAVIVGVPHEVEGELPFAFVRASPNHNVSIFLINATLSIIPVSFQVTKDEIIDLSTTLGSKNTLSGVQFLEEMPRTLTLSKVKKYILKNLALNISTKGSQSAGSQNKSANLKLSLQQ